MVHIIRTAVLRMLTRRLSLCSVSQKQRVVSTQLERESHQSVEKIKFVRGFHSVTTASIQSQSLSLNCLDREK